MECGCGYKNGDWKYDMQSMVFKDGVMKTGPIEVQPSSAQYFEDDDRYEDDDD